MPQFKTAVYLIIAGEALVAAALLKLQQVRLSTVLVAAAVPLIVAALCLVAAETAFYGG